MQTSNNQSIATDKPVWFITGCSTGFGHEMAKQLLERDYKVVITARNKDDLSKFAGHDNALILKLDVTDQAQINAAVKAEMPIAATIYEILWEHLPAAEGFKKIETFLV